MTRFSISNLKSLISGNTHRSSGARCWSSVILPLSLILLLIPAIQPLLTADFTCGFDNGFHLWRAVQVARCLRQGYLYPRWAPDMAHGYGFPLFIFHPPLTASAAALLNLIGLSWPLSINATFILGMLLAALFAFVFVRDLFGPAAGTVAAVAYVFSPFQAYDVFNRGSLSESFAWAFPPLILWATHRWSARGEHRFLPLVALGLTGFILTHNLFAFLFAPLLVAWVLLEAYLAHDWRAIGRGALAGLLGLGLCTFFWLPGLVERGWVQTDRLLGTWVFDYRNNFLDLEQLLAGPRATDPALINDWPPKALGLLPTLVALLALAQWHGMNRQTRWRTALFLSSGVSFAFLTLPASRPLWDRLPLLPYVQFPWRFLGPAAFCIAALAGIVASDFQTSGAKPQVFPTAALILLLTLGNLGWFYPQHCGTPNDTSVAGMIAWERATYTLGTTAKGEYLPVWVHRMPEDPELDAAYTSGGPIVRLPPESLPHGARVLRAEYGPVDATVVLESPVPFSARYLAFYYPGWRVTIDGEAVPIAPNDPDGLIAFDVPAGRHTVRVRFAETPLRLVADVISILSLVALIAVLLVLCFHRTSHPSHPVSRPTFPVSLFPLHIWALLATASVILTVKLAIIDRFETPFRHTRLTDGHLQGVDIPTEITFGDEFVMLGHDELPEAVPSGGRFEVITYWQATQPGGPDYGVTINVVDTQGHHWHGLDVRSPRWHRTPPPAWDWDPDEYAIIALDVPLLSGTPPGRYSIEAVAFDRDTLAPLTAYDADGQALGPELFLGQITVTVPEAPTDPGSLSIQDRLDVALGPVTLLGANFDRDEAGPGDLVRLTTFWRTDEQSEHLELTVHLTLLNPDGSTVAEYNFPPTARWHPTTAWQPGDIWRGQHILYLPADLASGEYSWRLSMDSIYQSTDLPSTIDISAPDRTFSPPPVDVEIKTSLDDVFTLVGANLKPETSNLRPGDPLTVTLVWRAEDTATASYHVFLHLLGPDGALVAQSDGIPAHWTRPTTGWMPGEYITDERVLLVPDEASAGDYALAVGLYVPGEARLTTAEGSDTITLTTVSVKAP